MDDHYAKDTFADSNFSNRNPLPLIKTHLVTLTLALAHVMSFGTADNWLTASIRAAAIERTLKAGETLFRSGSRTAGLYQVIKGKVRLVRIDRAGREYLLGT
jgi:CRP-like cAMP-binding protein